MRCAAGRKGPSGGGPAGGFDARNFIALQLIGANRGKPSGKASDNPDDCACIFLGPTLQLDESGSVNLKSRLDLTDGTTAAGARRGVPIPLASEAERELLACLRGYGALDPKRVPGRTLGLLERSQAFVKSRCLHDQLPLLPEERRGAIQRIQQTPNAQWPKTALDVALAMWREAECAVAMVVLDEVESLVLDDAIALGAFIGYRHLRAPPRGDFADDGAGMAWLQSADLTPSLAVALAVKAGAPIYLRREIYEDTLCDLARGEGVGGGGGGDAAAAAGDGECKTDWRVDPAQAATWRPPQNPRQLIQRAERGLTKMQLEEEVRQPVWEMRAADVLTMGQEQLRFLLRKYSVPTRRRESVEDMIEKGRIM